MKKSDGIENEVRDRELIERVYPEIETFDEAVEVYCAAERCSGLRDLALERVIELADYSSYERAVSAYKALGMVPDEREKAYVAMARLVRMDTFSEALRVEKVSPSYSHFRREAVRRMFELKPSIAGLLHPFWAEEEAERERMIEFWRCKGERRKYR